MMTWIWVNIGSGNGLLPDNTKQLPEPISEGLWHSPESNFTVRAQATIPYSEIELIV